MTVSEAMLFLDTLPQYFSYRIERNVPNEDVVVVFFGYEHHLEELEYLLCELDVGGLEIG